MSGISTGERIARLLRSKHGEWVPVSEINKVMNFANKECIGYLVDYPGIEHKITGSVSHRVHMYRAKPEAE